jgi:hypothetical protein
MQASFVMTAAKRFGIPAAVVLVAVGLWRAGSTGPRRAATKRAEHAADAALVGAAGSAVPSASAAVVAHEPSPGLREPRPVASFDRAEREQVRERIWRAFGQTPPAEPLVGSPRTYVLPAEPPPDPPGDAGHLEPEYIRQHVRDEFFGPALQCYTDAQPRLSDPRGRVVFWFAIVGDEKVGGVVESVDVLDESTLRDPRMIECMRQSFLSVTFPPPKGGGYVTVKYPVEFAPDDDE